MNIKYEAVYIDNLALEIREVNKRYRINLGSRIFQFAVSAFKLLKTFPDRKEYDVLKYQLSKSATSIGANYEEAQAYVSKKDSIYKISISLKEAKESNYWLRIIKAIEIGNKDQVMSLIQESVEIKNMLGTIYTKLRQEDKMTK